MVFKSAVRKPTLLFFLYLYLLSDGTYMRINNSNTIVFAVGVFVSCWFSLATVFARHYYDDNAMHSVDSVRKLIPQLKGQELLDAYTHLTHLYYILDDVDNLLALYDVYIKEAHRQQNLFEESYARMGKYEVFYNFNYFDSLRYYLPGMKRFFSEHENYQKYFYAGHLYVNDLIFRSHFELALQEAEDNYAYARTNNISLGLGATATDLGRVYQALGRYDDALRLLDEAVRILTKENDKRPLFSAYDYRVETLLGKGLYNEALEQIKEWEEELEADKYKIRGEYEENTSTDWFDLYSSYVDTYINMGDLEAAKEYIQKMEAEPASQSPMATNSILSRKMDWYAKAGEFAKALELLSTVQEEYSRTGDWLNAIEMLQRQGDYAGKLGRHEASASAYKAYISMNDSIQKANANTRLDELRTIYEVDKLNREKERQRTYVVLFVFISSFLFLLVLGGVFYSRNLTIKNKRLVKQIHEYDRLKKELVQKDEQLRKAKAFLQVQHDAHDCSAEESSDDVLLDELRVLINDEQIYTDSGITRKSVAEKLNTNERKLQDVLVRQYNMSFSEYITAQRLNHAKELLASKQNITIEGIATEAGFGSRYTFHRLFREHYGLSPSEYRKLL